MLMILKWISAALRTIFIGQHPPARTQSDPEPSEPQRGDPSWMGLARAELGTKEIPGPEHNPAVLTYFRDAGFPGINDDETAWCAAFANSMLERAGVGGSKSLAARDFERWGKLVKKPYPGCIAVLWRGNPNGWQGHVGFYVGERGDKIKLLGGNQSNAVTMQEFPRAQLLSYREPVSIANSRTTRASTLGIVAAGAVGTAVIDSQTQLLGVNAVLKDLGVTVPSMTVVAALLQIAVFTIIIWARWDDAKTKGR